MGVSRRQQLKIQYVNYYGTLILYIITMLPFLGLYGVKRLLGENLLLTYQTGAMLVLCAMVFMRSRLVKIDLFSFLYIALQGLIMGVTTANYGFSSGIAVTVCANIFFVLLVQADGLVIFKALAYIGIVAILWNAFDMIWQGIHDSTQFFVGGKNSFAIFMVPVGFAVIINKLSRSNRITSTQWVFLLVIVISILVARSAAGIVTALTMVLSVLWVKKYRPNVLAVVLTMAAIYILLAFFADVLVGTGWWYRVTQWLGKDVTLTSRFSIWEQVLKIWKSNFLVGVGRGAEIKYTNSWGRSKTGSEAHNFLLELLLEGGIIGLLIFCCYFWLAVRKLDMNSKMHRMVLVANMAILVNGLVESVNNKLVVGIFIALAHACSTRNLYEKGYNQTNDF